MQSLEDAAGGSEPAAAGAPAISVDTDPSRFDLELIHGFLGRSYWARGIPRELVERSIRHSLCFGVYEGSRQVGFARVISDYATFAYLSDVFVLESHRGRGLASLLVRAIRAHPSLQGLRRWLLSTRDAQPLYARHGFVPVAAPGDFMEICPPDPYAAAPADGSPGAA
jgi:GNAT superfamily N-acetyltransferase